MKNTFGNYVVQTLFEKVDKQHKQKIYFKIIDNPEAY